MIIRHMRAARWIPKATNTHSEYVTLIALPMQQWLRERTSVLFYTYIARLVILDFLHLLVCSTRSTLFYILRYAWKMRRTGRDTRVPLLFRGHNTWAYRRFLWRGWHHAEREDTQVRVRILISSNVMRVIKRVLQKTTSLLAVIVLFLPINNSSSVTRPVSCCSFDSRLISTEVWGRRHNSATSHTKCSKRPHTEADTSVCGLHSKKEGIQDWFISNVIAQFSFRFRKTKFKRECVKMCVLVCHSRLFGIMYDAVPYVFWHYKQRFPFKRPAPLLYRNKLHL